jgi:Protein of unknown function (DUF1573)
MKKNIFILVVSILFLVSCDVRKKDKTAQIANNELKKQVVIKDPTTVQIIDSSYSFGKVVDGAIVEYSFRFKNTGSKPLVITSATASCGCTVPEKPEAPIPTGDTGFIKVKFNSAGRVGMVHKNVTVSSNADPAFPELVIKGEVIKKTEQGAD